jgi:hypothetical protein
MNTRADVYLYGQVLGTHSFLLRDGFLKPDEYSEIKDNTSSPAGRRARQRRCWIRWAYPSGWTAPGSAPRSRRC